MGIDVKLDDELVQSLRDLASRENLPELAIAADIVKLALKRSQSMRDKQTLAVNLTYRERQVAFLYYQGLTRRQICEHLHITPETVRTHLRNIRRKLGTNSIQDLRRILANLPPAFFQGLDAPNS